MKYSEYIKQEIKCPFCHKKRSIVHANKKAYITYNLAPYHPHHMLVVPRRHVVSYEKLHKPEEEAIGELIKVGISMLNHLGYRDYSVLVRNGEKIGKSVRHLHYHIVPKVQLICVPDSAPKEIKDFVRDILTPAQIKKTMADFKKAFGAIKR